MARTGKLIWYFQMVHHDIWDYDNGTTPMLLTVRHDGSQRLQRHRFAFSQSWPRGDGRWFDFHWDARSQGSSPRFRDGESLVGSGGGSCGRGDARRISNRRTRGAQSVLWITF